MEIEKFEYGRSVWSTKHIIYVIDVYIRFYFAVVRYNQNAPTKDPPWTKLEPNIDSPS